MSTSASTSTTLSESEEKDDVLVLYDSDREYSSFRANMSGTHRKVLAYWAKKKGLKRGMTGAMEDILDRLINQLHRAGKVEYVANEDEVGTGS